MNDPSIEDVVVVTSEDDATDELSTRMEHARRTAAGLKAAAPGSILVHPGTGGTYVLMRTHDDSHRLTIGTTLARRFEEKSFSAGSVEAMTITVLTALDRYGTIDPRQDELRRRCRLLTDRILHQERADMPDVAISQTLLAVACPWSGTGAEIGGYDEDGNWHEPYVDVGPVPYAFLPHAVEAAIDAQGTIRITALSLCVESEKVGALDAMERLRIESAIAGSTPFPGRTIRR